jgi:hypothetical protein
LLIVHFETPAFVVRLAKRRRPVATPPERAQITKIRPPADVLHRKIPL